MPAPQPILDLVTRFGEHIDAYKSGSYNETQLRRDFLDPFFKLLGWDIDNTAGYDEAYRDVIHEDQVKIGGAVKAPDYGFRIGGTRKFFLEAKKPSIRIKDDISPAYQLRHYAWSAKLPLSILSDFEEFAIYDTRIKPLRTDAASKARIFYCRFDEYAEKWDHISGIFSREAILKGSFDKFAATNKGKRGTTEVDADFLATIEGWRADLARNLALRNPDLTQRELNFAVQRILDRIIFLRICEDRGIEDYERLKRAAEAKAIYTELVKLFQQADDRYNSGLFHFRSEKGRNEEHDTLTPHLVIDDKLLKGIVTSLYYPHTDYAFRYMPADILGQVYEQFLGKIIRLTDGHQAKVEDKPEVKKAGGVFYTPTYIVDYIVRQTIGPLVEGKTPKQIEKLTVLDPACGSGSFLIGAYQFLLDWYHHFYASHDTESHAKGKNPKLVAANGGGWVLTTTERKRILLAHIYGVDIDSQAVEVTKLSLLLKVLEGETAQTVQRELIHERVLPDLGENIKCGNSLIASNFYAQPGLPEMDAEAHLRINVFDWDGKDGFPEIMKRGGFDAVIGNPPYIRIQTMQETQPQAVEYFGRNYASATAGNYDIYVVFTEKALALMRSTGRTGFIVPHKFFSAEYGQPLRGLIGNGHHLNHVVHVGDQQVFTSATTYTCLLFLTKAKSTSCHYVQASNLFEWRNTAQMPEGKVSVDAIKDAPWNFHVGADARLMQLLNDCPRRLKDVARLFVGLQTDADDVYILDELRKEPKRVLCASEETGRQHWFESDHVKPFLKGSVDIRRYGFSDTAKRLVFPYRTEAGRSVLIPPSDYAKEHPLTWTYIEENKQRLAKRARGTLGDAWHGYVYKKNHLRFEQPKILAPAIATGACFAWDGKGEYYFVGSGGGGGGGYGIVLDPAVGWAPLFLLGILNSRLTTYFLKKTSTPFRGGYIALNRQYIENVPLPEKPNPAAHDRIVSLVEKMLGLRLQRAAAKTPHEQTAIERQINAVDAMIDREVYALYELREEEIALVEGRLTVQAEPLAPSKGSEAISVLDATVEYPHKGGYSGHMVFREEAVEYKTKPL